MGKKRTSISIEEVNKEYVDKADINLSELVDEAINRRRLAATKSRPEQLRDKISSKEEELSEAKAKVRALEAELEELEEELELYEEGERDMLDDLLEVAELAVNVEPEKRDRNQLPMAENAGLTPEQLAEALEYAEVHSVDPVAFTSLEKLQAAVIGDNDERHLVPDELQEEDDPEITSDKPSHWVALTEQQKEALKEWAEREI